MSCHSHSQRRINCLLRFLLIGLLLSSCQPYFVPPESASSRLHSETPAPLLPSTPASLLPSEAPLQRFPAPPLPSTPIPLPPRSPAPLLPSTSPPLPLLPDSEVVYSPSAVDFDIAGYLNAAGGWLNGHREYLMSTGWNSAASIVSRVALENSINPRLLLSLLEYQCRCVLGQPDESVNQDYLLGMENFRYQGLYRQLSWAASQLSVGYYGWRGGSLQEIPISDHAVARPAKGLNPGSVALQFFFSRLYADRRWAQALDLENGLPDLHARMFGNPWGRAGAVEPVLPGDLVQPELSLPFQPGVEWSFSSGPHPVWEREGALAALDFAPSVPISGCIQSDAWVTAMADGWVARVEFGAVIQDLSVGSDPGDGLEQTGWALLYMHIEERDRISPGIYLHAGDPIGHPSCEGGRANGTHVHIARKYNGEWVLAAGSIPFVLSGWVAHGGSRPYEGSLTKDGLTVIAHPSGSRVTYITLADEEP